MKKNRVLTIAALLVVASVALARESGNVKVESVREAAADRLIVKPAAELTWTDLDPKGAPGVKVADLWGDHAKGAFGAYFKLPPGFAVRRGSRRSSPAGRDTPGNR